MIFFFQSAVPKCQGWPINFPYLKVCIQIHAKSLKNSRKSLKIHVIFYPFAGGKLKIKCKISGSPRPRIVWLKNNRPIHQDIRISIKTKR